MPGKLSDPKSGVGQVLPEHVPSLYGCFPEDLYSTLQGCVPEVDLRKARHRAATEYGKIKESGSLKNVTEDKFSWAISVRTTLYAGRWTWFQYCHHYS